MPPLVPPRCFAILRTLPTRLFALACAILLALSMVPFTPALAEEGVADTGVSPSVAEMLDVGAYLEGEALVVYRPDAVAARSRSLDGANSLASAGFSVGESWDFSGVGSDVNALSLDEEVEQDAVVARVTKPGSDTAALLEELQAMDGVLAAAPNYVHESIGAVEPAEAAARLTAEPLALSSGEVDTSEQPVVDGTDVISVNGTTATTTNDPLSALQWALDNEIASGAGVPADSDVDLSSVYAAAAAGTSNIVAVLDSGVDYTNEDLQDAMWENPGNIPGVSGRAGTHGFDFIDGDDEPLPESNSFEESHGTHCAGIVAASSGNATGTSGISPNTKIMAFRTTGASTGGNINDGAILSSYEYLLRAKLGDQNVVAASNSWGGIISPVTEYAMNQAGRAGVLTVFAAGNYDADANSPDGGYVTYGLSESPYILSVAATSPQGGYATYSNYGETVVDVAAPGSVVLSTVAKGAQTYLPAVAKLLDEAETTPGARSFYYHNMADFAQENSGARIVLYDKDGAPLADQTRLKVSVGVGLDGRKSLQLSGATNGERVAITWYISNPFKEMTWEKAQNIRLAALPGASIVEQGSSATDEVYAEPLVLAEDGTRLTDGTYSVASVDNQSLASARLESREAFEHIQSQDTLRVGVLMYAYSYSSEQDSLSFTVTDFGMGYPSDDQAYDYMSGTSMACPLVAGAIGLLASMYPDELALELRGRIVGGTKPSNLTARGQTKRTASNGTLDLSAAAGDVVHPNTWGASEGTGSQGAPALVLEGYALDRTVTLTIDGAVVDAAAWEIKGASQLVIHDASLLDGGRHSVRVADGAPTHTAAYAFPKTDQRLAFQHVTDLPDPVVPGEVGFDSGLLVSASDRLFCLDSKGRYLYAYDPDGADGWTQCAAPSDAGFDLSYFRVDGVAAYADGKLYLTVSHDEETGDPEKPYHLLLGVIIYDIATDTWDSNVLDFIQGPSGNAGTHFASLGAASCGGRVYLSINSGAWRAIVEYDPATGDASSIDFEEADPDGVFSTLVSGDTAPLVAIRGELRFVGFLPEGDGYAMTLGTFDGETFGALKPGVGAPRVGTNELDALEGYARQAAAATGDSIVFTGASADGLGDTYLVNAQTGEWRTLNAKAPGDGSVAVSTACFYRGAYYVLAANTSADGKPTTALYCLPDEVELTPNDHVASAQASEGGQVEVVYGAAAANVRAIVSSQVDHVALGDTITWIATPNEGYVFSGWYGEDDSLISKDATYRQPVIVDIALSARFVATAVPDPAPDPTPDPKPEPTPMPTPLAPTGDRVGVAAALAAAAVIVCLACAAVACKRIRRLR